jgi:alpha-beta hydrolase superfamily lysophospholipase
MQTSSGYFKGHDGTKLFFRSWESSPSKGNIIVTHGMGEHSGCYQRLAEGIESSGWNLQAWDLRGHGKSDGKRGVIKSFKDFSDDLAQFTAHVGKPDLFIAHSLGGLVNLRTLIDHGTFGAKGLALSSPLLGIAMEISAIKKSLAKVLAKYLPDLTIPAAIPPSDLTSDPSVLAEYKKDSLRHDRSSSVLYFEMIDCMNFVISNAHKVQLPILVQQAGNDKIVSSEAGKKMYENLGSKQKKLIVYDGFKHEIFNELERKRVFTDLKVWLSQWSSGNKN